MPAWHMIASSIATGIAVATIGGGGSARADEPDRCALEGVTTVCRIEGQALRVIQETQSPSGRYAVAWLVPTTEHRVVKEPGDGSVSAKVEVANMLVRLDNATIVARQAGTHPGDRARYNHLQVEVRWSPGSRFVGVLNQDKWETLSGAVFRIAPNERVADSLDLLAFSREAGLRHLSRHQPQIDPETFATRLTLETVADNGEIRAKVTMEEAGGGGAAFRFSIALRVDDIAGKLRAKVIRRGRLRRL